MSLSDGEFIKIGLNSFSGGSSTHKGIFFKLCVWGLRPANSAHSITESAGWKRTTCLFPQVICITRLGRIVGIAKRYRLWEEKTLIFQTDGYFSFFRGSGDYETISSFVFKNWTGNLVTPMYTSIISISFIGYFLLQIALKVTNNIKFM